MDRKEVVETYRENRKKYLRSQTLEMAVVLLVILPVVVYHFQNAL